jgi:ribosomal protein S18 acetylase RimI-like enzyme
MNKFQHILQPKSITLSVNRQNFKSINFYFKNGFKIKSVEDFDIGNDYEMNDFVMVKYYN